MLAFVILELFVRPAVEGVDLPFALEVLVWSFPNVAEAVAGMTILSAGLDELRRRFRPEWSAGLVPLVAAAAALAYVVPQEFGLHHLGGLNVVDPWDAAASVAGVLAMAFLIGRYGAVEPRATR